MPKAPDLILPQISPGNRKVAYVDHKDLFARNAAVTGKPVQLLAAHITDEVMNIGSPNGVILAGGGSLMPGMADALSKTIGCDVIPVDDPVMSNAKGFEAKAASLAVITAKKAQEKAQ